MPPGHIQGPKKLVIGGVTYSIITSILDSGIFEDEDVTGLSDFEVSDSSDDIEEENDSSPHMRITGNVSSDDSSSVVLVRSPVRSPRYKKRDFRQIIKPEDSDSEDDSHLPSCSQNKVSKRSPTPPRQPVKEEAPQPQIFGYYFCEVCNLDMSSEKVYNDHMNGQRHRKNLKLKNVDMAVLQAMPLFCATEGISKYPQPPPGVIRKKVKQRAKIQDIIKYEVKKPCPGLNLVTEIQGLKETIYYCSICNAICSSNSIISHLTGFKHQLHLVKHFKPGDYENINPEQKHLVKDKILGVLHAIQKRHGLGRMTVEIEEFVCGSNDTSYKVSHRSTIREETSLQCSGMTFSEFYSQSTVPDQLAPDYYCEHCDSHMNSEDMWKSHIAGKRHIANLKKLPGDKPSKTKTVALDSSVRPKLLDRLENECPGQPIVGLERVREVQHKNNPESYNCYICCSCHTSMDIIDHLVSLKHRKKYLDFINYPYMQHISGMPETSQASIVSAICSEIEERQGRLKPTVHINKSSFFG